MIINRSLSLCTLAKSVSSSSAKSAVVPHFSKYGRRFVSASPENASKPEFYAEPLQDSHAGITILTLNRPDKKNALGKNLLSLMRQSVDSLRHDRSVRAVIIRSSSAGIFCSGADLKEREKMREEDVPAFVGTHLRGLMATLYDLPMPTIAAMDGLAVGGGLEMALACDLRVASSSAKMGLVETTIGIFPGAGGTQFLTRLVGESKAKQLIFTGEIIDGKQAKEFGIVNYVTEQNSEGDAAFKKALSVAERILANGPVGVKLAKLAINKGGRVDLNTALAMEESYYAQVVKTKDRLEGLAAFKEKRKPKFIGE